MLMDIPNLAGQRAFWCAAVSGSCPFVSVQCRLHRAHQAEANRKGGCIVERFVKIDPRIICFGMLVVLIPDKPVWFAMMIMNPSREFIIENLPNVPK